MLAVGIVVQVSVIDFITGILSCTYNIITY